MPVGTDENIILVNLNLCLLKHNEIYPGLAVYPGCPATFSGNLINKLIEKNTLLIVLVRGISLQFIY